MVAKSYLFVSIPDFGHYGPLLEPAKRLQQKGHTVRFASLDEAREKIEKAGLTFIPLGGQPWNSKEQEIIAKGSFNPSATPHEKAIAIREVFVGEQYGVQLLGTAC